MTQHDEERKDVEQEHEPLEPAPSLFNSTGIIVLTMVWIAIFLIIAASGGFGK